MEYLPSSSRRSTNLGLPPSSPSRLSLQSHHHEDRNPPLPRSLSHDSPHRRVPRHAHQNPLSPPSVRKVTSKRTNSPNHRYIYPHPSPGIMQRDDFSIDRLSVIASSSLPEADSYLRDSRRSQKHNDYSMSGARRPKSTSSISRSATAALSSGRAASRNHSSSRSSLRPSSLQSSPDEGDVASISSRRSETSSHHQSFSTPRTSKKEYSRSVSSVASSGDNGSRRPSWNSSPAHLALPVPDAVVVQQHIQSTCQILDELRRSHVTSVEKRCLALMNACQLFDHSIDLFHNIELTHGALTEVAMVLFLHQQQFPHIHQNMLHLILLAAEMLFRGSPSALTSAFHNIQHPNHTNDCGGILLLQTLQRILDRLELPSTTTHAKQSNDASGEDPEIVLNRKIVHNIGLILISFTRSSELRSILYQDSELLTEFTKISSVTRDGKGNMSRKTNPDCRLRRLQILAHFLQNSSHTQRELLYQSYGLADAVLRFAHFDPVDSVRQAAVACIVEFTITPKICHAIAQDVKYLGALVKILLLEDSTTSITKLISMSIRESALTALQNIAFDRLNRSSVVRFKNGLVLEVLKKTLTSNFDPKLRRRAANTVVNLVGDETAEFMVAYKGLLDTLALVATQDDNRDVQVRSVLALTKLASYIADHCKPPTEPLKSYSTVLDALVVASLNKIHCPRVTAVVRSISRSHPDQRPILAEHDGIVDTLTDILHMAPCHDEENVDDDTHSESRKSTLKVSARVNAIHSMAHLANSDDNVRVLLCCRPAVLSSMVQSAQYKDTQDVALRVLERFATVAANRSLLARCPGLLVAVAQAVERETRADRRQEHRSEDGSTVKSDGLAKALLLSLLLAL